jgi:hypothetical protein
MRKYLTFIISLALAGSLFAQEKPATEDKFPNACVDCHKNRPDAGYDGRLSATMTRWFTKTDPRVVIKAQGAAPSGVTLAGVHPQISEAFQNIPSACITCHRSNPNAPRFDNVIHLIHLTGERNHFLTTYQGACTICHKLNTTTGEWKVPSNPE